MLNVKNLNVAYGEIQVLWDVSFSINEKEIVSIVGPNGAGKSTLINAISGIIPIKSGEVEFIGKKINSYSAVRRVNDGLIQVPEGRRLFPQMTVLDNLKIGAYSHNARNSINENLEMNYEIFPILNERKSQVAGSLSGGEQQMLAIGMALMGCPKLLMLDEPSVGLAPIIVDRVMEAIETIKRDLGITVLLVEQNVFLSLEIADHGYVIENGRIVMKGEGKKLLNDSHIKDAYLSI